MVPIKKGDAQMLTRRDIQYDLLHYIFSDESQVFTDQTGLPLRVTFRDLYINVLYNSSKCSKVLKDNSKIKVPPGKLTPPYYRHQIFILNICRLVRKVSC